MVTIGLQGVWPACATIMTSDEALDEEGMARVVRFLIDNGVDGLWLLGGGGEGAMLTLPTRRRVVEVVLQEVGGAIPVVAGLSAPSTALVIENYRAIADLPVDGVFATAPFYYVCSQREARGFYERLLDELDHPMVVYNNPHVTGVTINPATIEVLAADPR